MSVRETGFLCVAIAGLFGPACGDLLAQGRVPPDALVIAHGRVIDGTFGDPINDGIVVIREQRIIAVGEADAFEISADVETIDATGMTVLPGIIDAHVHTTASPKIRRQFLEAGVTAVCDAGSPLRDLPRFEQDRLDGMPIARGLSAGPIMTAPGGLPDAVLHQDLNYEVGTPDEAQNGVADLVDRGVDFLKVYLHPSHRQMEYPMLEGETLVALVNTAHERDVIVHAHATQLAVLESALDAGVDAIDHVPKPPLDRRTLEESLANSEDPLTDLRDLVLAPDYDVLLPRMVEQGVVLVPTLGADLARFRGGTPDEAPFMDVITDGILEIVRRFHVMGGAIALGTDYNSDSDEPAGMPLVEMQRLLEAGLTPTEVLQAGTQRAAYVCGHGAELGTLEPGMLADVIVVDGDPLEDIEALGRIVAVVKDGEVAFLQPKQ